VREKTLQGFFSSLLASDAGKDMNQHLLEQTPAGKTMLIMP
jgi:hypothetical protein